MRYSLAAAVLISVVAILVSQLPAGSPGEAMDAASAIPARAEASGAAGPALPKGEEPSGSSIVWVRRGQSVEIFDSPRGKVVASQADETEFGSPSVFSVQRDRGRWLGVSTHLVPNGDLGWIREEVGSLASSSVPYSVVIDLSDRSAAIYRGESEIRSWQVTVGALGTETPTGKFAITDTFRDGLNAAYGCCAVALSATQPNLPSGWLAGNRIAIHGTTGPLGIAASSGCIRSADRDVNALLETAPLGTPVKIRD